MRMNEDEEEEEEGQEEDDGGYMKFTGTLLKSGFTSTLF